MIRHKVHEKLDGVVNLLEGYVDACSEAGVQPVTEAKECLLLLAGVGYAFSPGSVEQPLERIEHSIKLLREELNDWRTRAKFDEDWRYIVRKDD